MGRQWQQWMIDFIFLGFKITTDGDWSHEIKRHLLSLVCMPRSGIAGSYGVKFQKEKNNYHMLMHICAIWKNWYRWPYLQSRNRDTDVENIHIDTKGDRESGMNWGIGIDIYTRPSDAYLISTHISSLPLIRPAFQATLTHICHLLLQCLFCKDA